MTGGRHTKEIMVYAPTKPEALAKLLAAFDDHRRTRGITVFAWRVKPQALRGKVTKEWRAYGRIEWK